MNNILLLFFQSVKTCFIQYKFVNLRNSNLNAFLGFYFFHYTSKEEGNDKNFGSKISFIPNSSFVIGNLLSSHWRTCLWITAYLKLIYEIITGQSKDGTRSIDRITFFQNSFFSFECRSFEKRCFCTFFWIRVLSKK